MYSCSGAEVCVCVELCEDVRVHTADVGAEVYPFIHTKSA